MMNYLSNGIRVFLVSLLVSVMGTTIVSSEQEQEIIVAHGISKFGNLKYSGDFKHFDYVNPSAPKGGEISISTWGSFDSMNPYSRKGISGALSSIFFESLLVGNADEVSADYGLIAETIEYPKDRSWVIFNLRPEARFSDGSELTAEDVLFTYELFLNEGLSSFRAELGKAVDTAEILSPYQIKFTFKTDDRASLDDISLVGGLPIFSKKWFEETGAKLDESRLEPALGSGPYVLDTLDVNKRVIYKRNPDYWGWHIPAMVGQSNFDRIRIEYFADVEASFEGFKAGETTFRPENVSKNWATRYDFPAVEKGWVVKKEIPDGSLPNGQSFAFNLRKEKFQDIRVREAISLMFNFEWTNATTFHDLYARIDAFWENSHLKATGLPTSEELIVLEPLRDLLPEEIFTEEPVISPSSNPERRLDRRNLRAASRLLDEAGWLVGDDGMRKNADGQQLDIEFLTASATFERIIQPYVENLKQLGVNAYLTKIDSAQLRQREKDRDFDITISNFPISFEPGGSLRQYLGSEHVDGIFNDTGLSNPAVDKIITYILDAQTIEELERGVIALDRVLRQQRIVVFHWYRDFHTVAYYDMYEYPENIPPFSLGFLDFWWSNEEKRQNLISQGAISN